MGWPPAVIIVVRHGARLDAADKQWHLTSPTPYDPPLTYGGFTQSKTLGARIASILRTRETDDEAVDTYSGGGRKNGGYCHPDGNTRRRRHKVVIHSSPFLRCVQTSIGISAGLAQDSGHMYRSPSHTVTRTSSPRSRPTIATNSPRLAPIAEPINTQEQEIKKSTIRVDAFLGEWLSPDYFEQITPPPSSIMMVASAKADLLRREDYSNLLFHTRDNSSASLNKGFPGGWQSPTTEGSESPFSMSSLHQALSRRDRTSSLSSVHATHQSGTSSLRPGPTLLVPEHSIYIPPIPSYAISSVDPIPQGYVAHARDACVDVDYQWDSMRAPQNWGNGGEYGEEWSSMHKRFRKGLQNLVNWYSEKASPFDRGNKTHSRSNSGAKNNIGTDCNYEEEEEDDTDLVVILVTHGAGCNALIGALTNQPVLIDVGMASLTMAVRKTTATPLSTPSASPPASPSQHSRVAAKVLGISDEYDVKLIANTEHLRLSSNTPSRTASTSRSSSPGYGGISVGSRYPTPLSNSSGNPFESGIAFGQPVNAHRTYLSGPIRRSTSNSTPSSLRTTFSISTNTSQLQNQQAHRSNSIGLWSAAPTPAPVEDDMILNFGDDENHADMEKEKVLLQGQQLKPETPKNKMWLGGRFDGANDSNGNDGGDIAGGEEIDEVKPLGEMGNAGLWGSPRPPGDAERLREGGIKRRWTVAEN